jgi:hypothetical protein
MQFAEEDPAERDREAARTFEITIRRELSREFKIDSVLLDFPRLRWRTVYNNIGGGRQVILALVEGDADGIQAVKERYVDDPPTYMERLLIVRESSRSVLLFSAERIGELPLDIAVLIERHLGAETASSGSKDTTGSRWHVLTLNQRGIRPFLRALETAYTRYEAQTKRALPHYVVESYHASGAFTASAHAVGAREGAVAAAALRLGYYSKPRKSDIKSIAAHLKMAASTVQYHLAAAESKAMNAMLPAFEDSSSHAPVGSRSRGKIGMAQPSDLRSSRRDRLRGKARDP